MDDSPTVTVIRVTRPDTILIRATSSLLQSMVSTYLALEGVTCDKRAEDAIIDWVEVHADAERLHLFTCDWLRDEYGRLLGDLADIQTGETLTSYLLEQGVAQVRPNHVFDVIFTLCNGKEPE
jgi:hypothetical protein